MRVFSRPKARFWRTDHMRIERVGLEHHGEPPIGRRHLVDELAVDQNVAAGRLVETGDHPQKRRFSAAGRADEDDELAVLHLEIDVHEHLTEPNDFETICSVRSLMMFDPISVPCWQCRW